jgi:FkbM family methyltransferase
MRTVAYCGDHTALTMTKHGDKIYVDTRDLSLAPHIMMQGDWEPWVSNCFHAVSSRLLETSLAKTFVFVDVGANVGWYSLLAARFGSRHIFAYEPNPRLCSLLRDTFAVNGSPAVALQRACADRAGEEFFYFRWNELGGGTIVPNTADRWDDGLGVKVVTLDADARGADAAFEVIPWIIKIDVEGAELRVLRGAERILHEGRPILFVEHHKDNAVALWELLSPIYTLRHVQHTGHPSAPLNLESLSKLTDAEMILCEPTP